MVNGFTPSLLDSLGLTYSIANDVRDPYRKDRGTTDYIKIASPDLATYLKCMGAVVPTKLPDAVHRLSPKLLLKFLESYQEADGRKSDTSYCVADSASLAFDLELICLKLGWAIDITRQTKNNVQMRIVRRGLQPLVKTDGEAPTIGTHGMVPYEGLVFCVTVPNRLVYVRRNKTTYWCGNSGRYGDKGIIARIEKDHDMPTDEQGRPFELLLNPAGLPTRVNPMQDIETALGKVAALTGKPYKLQDFKSTADLSEFARQELAKHGLSDTEDILDPATGQKIKGIQTGSRWMMKLHHKAEDKIQGRGLGSYSCFDKDTDVLTSRGWVSWPAVLDRDLFATLIDNKLTYQAASKVTRERYTGMMCGFEGRYVDYLVTPNHRMWVRKTSRGLIRPLGEFAFVHALHMPPNKPGQPANRPGALCSLKGWVARQAGFIPNDGNFPDTFNIPGTQSDDARWYQSQPGITIDSGDYAELCGWHIAYQSQLRTSHFRRVVRSVFRFWWCIDNSSKFA